MNKQEILEYLTEYWNETPVVLDGPNFAVHLYGRSPITGRLSGMVIKDEGGAHLESHTQRTCFVDRLVHHIH